MKTTSQLYLQIHDAILLQQRKSRFVALAVQSDPKQVQSGLSIAEGLLLLVLECMPEQNVRDLAEALKLERSWVSRIISALTEKKLVESYTPDEDRRSKKVSISRLGSQALTRLAQFRSVVINETFKMLNKDEQRSLVGYLKILALGVKAPDYLNWPAAHPIDRELARLSWAFSVLGENFMQSGMNVTRYQLFYELGKYSADFISATDLALIFPSDASTVSRTIVSLCQEGLAERQVSDSDGRKQMLRISDAGRQRWKDLLKIASDLYANALATLPYRDLKHFADIFEKVVAETTSRAIPQMTRHIQIRALSSTEVQAELTNLNGAPNLSAAFKEANDHQILGCYEAHTLKGLVALSHGKDLQLNSITLHAKDLSRHELMQFLKTALRMGIR